MTKKDRVEQPWQQLPNTNPASGAATFPEIFSMQLSRSGNACALRCGGRSLSYEELDARAASLAAALLDRGVQPRRAVALMLTRSIELIVAMLAVQKAGAYFVPIEPAQPEERLKFLFEDCGAQLIISQHALSVGLDAAPGRSLCLDDHNWDRPASVAAHAVAPDDPVYAIYTSGSTGKPKAAINYQKSVANLYSWFARELALGAQTSSLVIGSMSFDLYHKAVFGPLVSGGCVVLHESAVFDPTEIRALIASSGITLVCATPSAFNALIENADEAGMAQLASLRQVSLGGEVVRMSRLRPWLRHPRCGARVVNTYGPTECADIQTFHWITESEIDSDSPIPIGAAIPGCELHVLDEDLKPVADGITGRLWLGGICVGGGYINRPERTAQAFRPNPFRAGENMYDTGDLVSRNAHGKLDYHGRADRQVKISGYRIELDEVEALIGALPGVLECAATAPMGPADERILKAYVRLAPDARQLDARELRKLLAARAPEFLLPSAWSIIDRFPYNPSGKIDRKALDGEGQGAAAETAQQGLPLEQRITESWSRLLGCEIDPELSFFELGGTSVLAVRFVGQIARDLGAAIPMADFFGAPSVHRFAEYLRQRHATALQRWTGEAPASPQEARQRRRRDTPAAGPIAVVGMACRVPGAADVEVFWQNLLEGRDSIAHGASAKSGFVAASGWIEDSEAFDHEFFRYTPREAAIIDPQQRILMECAWHALEHAGIVAGSGEQDIGVYAGLAANSYLTRNLASHAEFRDFGMDQASIGNDKDFAATRIAYKLDLHGPAMTLQTGCSSTGTALHMACLALQAGDCDAAIVGGAALPWRFRHGHVHAEGGPMSRDGRVRSFDGAASGMVLSGGTACVVLKRLIDAEADGDTIYSVIRATALNNDGGHKAAFTAPGADAQAAVVRRALDRAGVSAADIGYVEAHGTGTPLGDPIEISALTRSYREDSVERNWCAIGSVKGNIGHLDAAAACAGLIKVSLALTHKRLPAQPHFERPHPECAMDSSPFHVLRETTDWTGAAPRRAALSSFGFGGTNFHAVIEEAPPQVASTPSGRRWHLLRLSARDDAALQRQAGNLTAWRQRNPEASLADAAWTLDVGRARLRQRGVLVSDDAVESATLLRGSTLHNPSLTWIFPGQGAQHPGMGARLYHGEPVFREAVDRCAEILMRPLGCDLRELLYSGDESAAERLRDTGMAQPAIFTVSWAMAQTWLAWGYEPQAVLGHSVGEFVAAALAEVFTLEDALALIAERGALMRAMPAGGMLAVRLAEPQLRSRLPTGLDIAAVNAPQLCVVSGAQASLDSFAAELAAGGIACTALHTSHAFHSAMMDPAVEPLRQAVERRQRRAPTRRIMSSVTGNWLRDSEATDPDYWARQLRRSVRFAPAVAALLTTPGRVLLEVGPGQSLAGAMRQQAAKDCVVVSSLPPAVGNETDDQQHAVQAMARLWIAGVEADPARYYTGERRNRIALPGYPFARVRHWIEPAAVSQMAPAAEPEQAMDLVLAMAETSPGPQPAASEGVQGQVMAAVHGCSGINIAAADFERSFIDLGFDSLLLTQLAMRIKQQFNTELRFRQLMRELSTPGALIRHLSEQAAPVAVASGPIVHAGGAVPASLRAGARLGRDAEGNPAWFVPDPERAGVYLQVSE